MGLFESMAAGIDAYTGLTPAAFFTIAGLMVGAYLLVSSFFVHPAAENPASGAGKKEEEKRSLSLEELREVLAAEPVQLGEVTLDELKAYDGSDPKKPLLIAIRGNVYDVSRGRLFYGPGAPYSMFAGRDASRALALMSFDKNDLTGDLHGLTSDELEVLQDWEEKFKEKYTKVGHLPTTNHGNEDVDVHPGQHEEEH